jgi:hypothetical protein
MAALDQVVIVGLAHLTLEARLLSDQGLPLYPTRSGPSPFPTHPIRAFPCIIPDQVFPLYHSQGFPLIIHNRSGFSPVGYHYPLDRYHSLLDRGFPPYPYSIGVFPHVHTQPG